MRFFSSADVSWKESLKSGHDDDDVSGSPLKYEKFSKMSLFSFIHN